MIISRLHLWDTTAKNYNMSKNTLKKKKEAVVVEETPVRQYFNHTVTCKRDFPNTDFKAGKEYDILVQKMQYDSRYMVYKGQQHCMEKSGYAVYATLEDIKEDFDFLKTEAKKLVS